MNICRSTPKRHMLYTFFAQYLLDSHNVRQDIYDMLEGRKVFDSSTIKFIKYYKDNEEYPVFLNFGRPKGRDVYI